ncbi:MAG: hypothetical protein JXQ72_08015 [Anaerolineae bacterium]|nr:hypothetical protein [Anaerolineae bacterium]
MNADHTLKTARPHRHKLAGQVARIVFLVVVVSFGMQQVSGGTSSVLAAGPDVTALQGWTVSSPTPAELNTFCAAM